MTDKRKNQRGNAGLEELRQSPMMERLVKSLQQGEDIGHYGRLTFVMVARHFLAEEEIIDMLSSQPGMDEQEARAMLTQVKARDYNPPGRQRVLEWQARQDYEICTDVDPQACNVYRELRFPEGIYENIEDFWEERAEE